VARGVRRGLGLAGCWYGEARGPGGAGCAIGMLSWHVQSLGKARLRGGVRWWKRKAAAFERGASAAGGEAGVEASSQLARRAGGVRMSGGGPSQPTERQAVRAHRLFGALRLANKTVQADSEENVSQSEGQR